MKTNKANPLTKDFGSRKGDEDMMILELIYMEELEAIDRALEKYGLEIEVFEGSSLNATLCRIVER